jgi:hypothetical protein
MASLSCAKTQGGGRGCSVNPGLGEGVEDVGGDVLVVEGDDVAGLGEPAYRRSVGVCPDRSRGDDQGRGSVLGLGEHGQLHAQGHGRRLQHAGQLAAPDHSHHRESSRGASRCGHRVSLTGHGAPTQVA